MRTLAAASLLALLCACSGYTSGDQSGGGGPVGNADSGQNGGDGGPDGGDGGGPDAGPDAGCVQLSLNVQAIDSCAFITPTTTTAAVSVDSPPGCAVSINLATASSPCVGVASHGTLDAFDGGCTGIGLPCTSPSLPGTLTCTTATGTCTIRICDAGVCSL